MGCCESKKGAPDPEIKDFMKPKPIFKTKELELMPLLSTDEKYSQSNKENNERESNKEKNERGSLGGDL